MEAKKIMLLKKLFKPVKSMDSKKATAFMETHIEGTFTLLDVRQPKEYKQAHIPGAQLIPLATLSDSLNELDPAKPVIVYCAMGGRSRVAAQLLSGQGFEEIYNLQGGIKAWQGLEATGPKELNLDLVRGDETPSEIVALAYNMEDSLQAYYKEMHDRAEDQELRELFFKLASIEDRHKQTILELSSKLQTSGRDARISQMDTGKMVLEGGFDMVEFMEQNEPLLKTVSNVIDLAMMLETQGLDLYLRFAAKSTNRATKDVLFKIAQEEKGHLAALGRLLEEKI
jgi:rhodanese-related sulfurtransferase/rubrerythrin